MSRSTASVSPSASAWGLNSEFGSSICEIKSMSFVEFANGVQMIGMTNETSPSITGLLVDFYALVGDLSQKLH